MRKHKASSGKGGGSRAMHRAPEDNGETDRPTLVTSEARHFGIQRAADDFWNSRQLPAYLGRKAAALWLTDHGYPTKASTLATMAVRGGGPPYEKFGRRTRYSHEHLIAWAVARTGPPLATTTEHRADTSLGRDPVARPGYAGQVNA